MQKSVSFNLLALAFGLFSFVAQANAQDHHDLGQADHNEDSELVAGDESAHGPETDEGFNATEMIMHHILDSHDWHIMDIDGHAVSIPLPVILWTDNGLVTFMSSAFHHDDEGHHVVEAGDQRFVKVHEKIYYASEQANEAGQYVEMHDHHPVNAKPIDLSLTKNAASLMVAFLLILWIFTSAARFYKKNGATTPRGLASFLEPLILFVRDDIARDNIGEKKYQKFVPYLLTLFFFIWINNLLGLIPFFPGGANVTGNIAVTLTLALFSLIIVNANANKDYWKHIFTPSVHPLMWIIMIPVELIGVFTKPFALMVRLFANITAGHIVVLSLISLIF
ncbi:MAG: F0F1 ATP synthase subunit A, partial [Bacteroidota bacterium]|nr:F0F1 ATP synthase subunit A [Bacteroidota bacterium]